MTQARPILVAGIRADAIQATLEALDLGHPVTAVGSPDALLLRAQESYCPLVVLDATSVPGAFALCEEMTRLDITSAVLVDDFSLAPRLCAAGAGAVLPVDGDFGPAVERLLQFQHGQEARADVARDLQRAASVLRDQIRAEEQRQRDQAHEIRTPVGIIRLFAHNLKDGLDGSLSDSQHQSVDAIIRAAEQLVELVSSPSGGSAVPSFVETLLEQRPQQRRTVRTQVPFGGFVAGVASMFKAEARRMGQTLTIRIEDELPKVWLDRAKMTQVVTNLLSNALKFTPEGGTVSVAVNHADPSSGGPRLRRVGGEVHLIVADDGPGIPQADLEAIFEHNNRGTSAVNTAKPGSGIGLAVVRELVHAHGGRVWAESVEGEGATFHVILPVDFRSRRLGHKVLAIEDEMGASEVLLSLAALQGRKLELLDPGDHEDRLQALLSGDVALLVSGSATIQALQMQDAAAFADPDDAEGTG